MNELYKINKYTKGIDFIWAKKNGIQNCCCILIGI